jgi:predicted Rossmann fold flavoprotein
MQDRMIVVVGAGAGGMMAAGRAAECGPRVLLLEKMEQPGKKILISGKTRCNLTNSREIDDFIAAFGVNGRFLYSAFSKFFRDDLLEFLQRYGLETKTERGGRIFPASDRAADVVAVFKRYAEDQGVQLKTGKRVIQVLVGNGVVRGVATDAGELPAKAVILATGGSSYPATGSTGDGYRMAKALGHTIVELRPALVPLVVKETDLAKSMQGVSLKNVILTAYQGKEIIASSMGEMMITHFGIGGPITLQMSLAIVDALKAGPVSVEIDLKPALDFKQLQLRLQREFDTFSKRSLHKIMKELLPQKMIEPLIELSGVPAEKGGYQINASERERLVSVLKSLRFNIKGPLSMAGAMVTAGGVALDEINPRTMESKLVKGLYFCGEVMDLAADTGGYNLQAAFSTGWVAGENAARYVATLR